MGRIDEKTNIPLFAAMAALPLLSATVLWIGSIGERGDANAARITANERKIEGQTDILTEIRDRVIRIEEQIKKVRTDR
jgi:cell division protein FtsB